MKTVRINEADARLIDRAFLPHNPNKLRGAIEHREQLKAACHRYREALDQAAEPASCDATFALQTLKAARAAIAGEPGAPPAAEILGALRIAILGFEG